MKCRVYPGQILVQSDNIGGTSTRTSLWSVSCLLLLDIHKTACHFSVPQRGEMGPKTAANGLKIYFNYKN